MKLFWCCVAAALLATVTDSAIDVERTVNQVQNILQSNDLLPRLSREEIIQLLNDIRDEDSKRSTTPKVRLSSRELKTTTTYRIEDENEIDSITQSPKSLKDSEQQLFSATSVSPRRIESTTKASGQTFTVVLPYTPRDGSSLQELYTRPPRVEVVHEKITPRPTRTSKTNLKDTLRNNAKVPTQPKSDFPAELQAFLDVHGLKGNPEKDHFLLPLDGFKPLPPAKIVDGNIQLPENILLTYDLISPADLKSSNYKSSETSFLYEPLRPEFPFELDSAASESKETVLPLDLPALRKPKSKAIPQPNYEPIDYDSVKVIPLNVGPDPVEQEKAVLESDPTKRQANATETTEDNQNTAEEPITVATDSKSDASDSASLGSDAGASISDLEDSFGGPAPETPGDSVLPPPKKNGFYWMLDWNSFLEVGDGDSKVNIRFEPKLGDPQMFIPVNVP